MDNIFRVIAEEENDNCTPISQSYSNKRDAVLQYHFTKDYIIDYVTLLVSEYSIDEEGYQVWVRDLTEEELKHI